MVPTIHSEIEKSKICLQTKNAVKKMHESKKIITCPESIPRFIAFYSTVETSDTAFVIGGQDLSVQNIVAQYYNDGDFNDKWRRLPDLYRGRYGHGSIMVGGQTLVIGGWAFILSSITGE